MNELNLCSPHSGARLGEDVRNYPPSYIHFLEWLKLADCCIYLKHGAFQSVKRTQNCCFCTCSFKKDGGLKHGTKDQKGSCP